MTDLTQWQPMDSEPNDGRFRLYGLHVGLKGHRWFEVHYVALDDDGQLVEPSGDSFSDWSFDDFECWAEAPWPIPEHRPVSIDKANLTASKREGGA